MSRDSLKVIKVVVKAVAVLLAIGAIRYNPGHLFTASMMWFGAEELCSISNEE